MVKNMQIFRISYLALVYNIWRMVEIFGDFGIVVYANRRAYL